MPIYKRGDDSRQHQRCAHHLNEREISRVFANKPTRNNSASIQEQVSGPTEPIEHDSLSGNIYPVRPTVYSLPLISNLIFVKCSRFGFDSVINQRKSRTSA